MFKNRFFKVNVFHNNSNLLNITELYQQFRFIIDNYDLKSHGIGIGALTADKRDRWAKVTILIKKYLNEYLFDFRIDNI